MVGLNQLGARLWLPLGCGPLPSLLWLLRPGPSSLSIRAVRSKCPFGLSAQRGAAGDQATGQEQTIWVGSSCPALGKAAACGSAGPRPLPKQTITTKAKASIPPIRRQCDRVLSTRSAPGSIPIPATPPKGWGCIHGCQAGGWPSRWRSLGVGLDRQRFAFRQSPVESTFNLGDAQSCSFLWAASFSGMIS